MKIELSEWEAFFWVAKESGFTRAAEKLKLSVPLVSRRVASLEEHLGVRLLQRSTRKVVLTYEGRGLFPHVQSFLEDAQSLEYQFSRKNEVAGHIRIACVTAFAHRVLSPLIVEFARLYPEVTFDLEITDSFLDLLDHQIDLAIRVQEPSGADFIFRKLLTNNLVVCASPQYLKGLKKPIRTPEDLFHHRMMFLKVYENCGFRGRSIKLRDFFERRQVHCESGLFLTQMALQGAGVAVRSLWDVYPLLKSGKLVRVLERYPLDPFGDMYAVIPTRRLLAYRIRTFVDFLSTQAKTWKF